MNVPYSSLEAIRPAEVTSSVVRTLRILTATGAALAAALASIPLAGCGNALDLSDYGAPSRDDAGNLVDAFSGDGGTGGSTTIIVTPSKGHYALGPIANSGLADAGLGNDAHGCATLTGVVRDFKPMTADGGHPDFERFRARGATPGLVAQELGNDRKPIYTSTCDTPHTDADCPYNQQTTGNTNFDQWYRFTEGINIPYLLYLSFDPIPNSNVATFDSPLFFPLDDAGWNDSETGEDGRPHNFGFTTELHTTFRYEGGERFRFSGDDDLWVFINGILAIDLGGVHAALDATLDLDASAESLGISQGNVYTLELFHAERHTTASHFRVDTTLTFVDCGFLPPEVR